MKELIINRELTADKQTVFNAWAKAENLQQWWGPKGFKTEVNQFEFTPGGTFHYSFRAAEAPAMWGKFKFLEIEAPHKIVFINSFSDEEGSINRAPFEGQWPLEIQNTIMLTENNGTTTLTLVSKPVHANGEEHKTFEENLENMRLGFGGTFDKLDEFLSKQ